MNAKNKGFTLVEIAIVLVIVGLLLGGVLKGQEMINNAKLKRVATDFEGIAAAIFTYQDRYNALPGDDAGAAARWTVTAGDGSGVIDNAWDSTTADDESRLFWRDLRLANLTPGAGTSQLQPSNPYGGLLGVMDSNFGLAGTVICMSGITGPNAQIIDNQLDDGVANTGTLRANTASTNNNASADYSQPLYTICKQLN